MLKRKSGFPLILIALSFGATMAVAGEGDITIPDLTTVKFAGLGGMSGTVLMCWEKGIRAKSWWWSPIWMKRKPMRPGTRCGFGSKTNTKITRVEDGDGNRRR